MLDYVTNMGEVDGAARSLRRFSRLIDMFDQERRPLTARHLGEALDAPRSSTAALLRTLVDLGLLSVDRASATYVPTLRFAQASAWVLGAWLPGAAVLGAMEALRARTQETVTLSTAMDQRMEVVRCLAGPHPISLSFEVGRRLDMATSAIGLAHLAGLPKAEEGARLRRLVRGRDGGSNVAALSAAIERARKRGAAVIYGAVEADGGGVALALPAGTGPRALVLSVGGPSERMRPAEDEIVVALTAAVRNLVGQG